MLNRLELSLAWLCTLLLAPATFASDGVIEINQICATQTGCSQGDAPGFPVSLAGGSSYILTSSLQVSGDVAALRGSGNSIGIDLNGFTISGNYFCSSAPPNCLSRAVHAAIEAPGSAVSVRNGTIRAWHGPAIDVGFGSRVEDLLIERGGNDGILARSGSIIRGNSISNLFGTGIRVQYNDEVSGDALVEGNIIQSLRGDGIHIGGGVVTENFTTNIFGSAGIFASDAGYGLNRFSSSPIGGTSMGNNVCGSAAC